MEVIWRDIGYYVVICSAVRDMEVTCFFKPLNSVLMFSFMFSFDLMFNFLQR